MKNLMENILLGTTKVNTNIDFILTHAYDDGNKYRIIINSNYNYLTLDDVQLTISKILELISPNTDLDYKNKLWWKLNLYTVSNNNSKIKVLSELVNFSINLENILFDNLTKDSIKVEPNNVETFFLIELINDNNKIDNKLIPLLWG